MIELRWHRAAAREAHAARRWYRVDQDAPDVARRFQAALYPTRDRKSFQLLRQVQAAGLDSCLANA